MTLLENILIISNITCVSIYIFEKYLNRILVESYQKHIEALKERIKEEFKKASLEITNWQKQKRYSEEEVITLLQKYRYDLSSGKTPNIGDTTKIWFEQNKNDIFNFDNIK